ncbi:jg22500 [Pararge aegeria aegeria]|uniref:Jg22500 protein n=1 Tax=Pararge aegeria aegeria TaxID=348720 RepID=A0A8S4RCM0_9NEOP|nr:jg22500 [Pararge aegeria aegeria]
MGGGGKSSKIPELREDRVMWDFYSLHPPRWRGSGIYWEAPGSVGRLRDLLGGSGICWEALGTIGSLWDLLGGSGIYWDAPGSIGRLQDLLGGSAILAYPAKCCSVHRRWCSKYEIT